MVALAVLLILSLLGFLLFMYFFKQDVLFRKLYRKRSQRDRRRKFIGSKNRMRRSGKDRRQSGLSE